MYTIQKHKAIKFILRELENDQVSIVHKNNIPKIRYMKNGHEYKTTSLENYCWNSMFGVRTRGNYDLSTFLILHVLKIYGVNDAYFLGSKEIRIPDIYNHFKFFLETKYWSVKPFLIMGNSRVRSPFTLTVQNTKYNMLLFLIDPLRAIGIMIDKPKDISIQHFFEHYRDIITKRDKELLSKYLLIWQIADKHIIPDIMFIIVDIIIQLLLI